jgi:integrase
MTQCEREKAEDKDIRLNDGGGLFLLVQTNGIKLWRMKYYVHGKQKVASFGQFPTVDLETARDLRETVGSMAAKGEDYNQQQKDKRAAVKAAVEESFEAMSKKWIKRMGAKWTPRHMGVVERSLEADVYPRLGSKHVSEITSKMILDTASKIADERGANDVARRVLRRISSVMEYAAITDLIAQNPAIGLNKYLPENKSERRHHPAISWKELPDFLKAVKKSEMNDQTRLGLELLMLTFVRPGELRFAKWKEFDLERKRWNVPASRMKMKQPHVVPLSSQALDVLEQLKPYSCGSDLLFPGRSTLMKPISENAWLFAIYRCGYKDQMTAHGYRGVASSWLNEEGLYRLEGKLRPFNPDSIERQLAHGEPNKVRDAYLQADFLGEREVMMQTWADFCTQCANTEKVVSIHRDVG